MSFSALLILLVSGLAAHRGRSVAASIAIAVAASVLLMALAGRGALGGTAPNGAQSVLRETELHLAATETVRPFLDEELLNAMRADRRVAEVWTAISVRGVDMPGTDAGTLDREAFYAQGSGGMGGWIVGRRDGYLAWDHDAPRGTLVEGRWPSPDATDPIEVVLPQRLAFGQKIGSWRRLETDTGVHRVQVVGIAKFPDTFLQTPQGVRLMVRQISRPAAEQLAGGVRPLSDARLIFRTPEDRSAFLTDWRDQVTSRPGRLELWDASTIADAALNNRAAQSMRTAILSAVLLSGACVVCLGLAVQGNAVRERAAQYTLLRSLGAGRGLLASLVLAEGGILASLGVLGAVLLAWAAQAGLAAWAPFLNLGSAPTLLNIAITWIVILASALAGSTWPAYLAGSTHPTEAAAGYDDPVRAARWTRRAAAAAFFVLIVAWGMVLVTPAGSMARATALVWIGVPGVAIGSLLLAPGIVRSIGFLFHRPVAWLTRTEPLILGDHIASDGPRSAGAVVAVSVGLGAFVWVMCWGASMLHSFVIDPEIPRWLISLHPYGLDRMETERVLSTPGLSRFQPLTLVDTRIGDTAGRAKDRAGMVPTLVMGLDLAQALGTGPDALPFQWIAGDRDAALAALASGDSCLISDWYATSAHLSVGDPLPVAVPGPAKAESMTDRTYRVAGIVELRGWRMMTKQNKVRLRGDKHRALVILGAETARRDFPVAHANYLLGNSVPGEHGRISRFRGALPPLEAYQASIAEREMLETAVGAAIDLERPIEHRPDNGIPTVASKRVAQVDDLDRTRHELLGGWGGGTVKKMGWLPLVALAVSLLSVTGTLVVSLRSRGRELGVLRSCGLTRFGLLRLAVAESLLIGVSAVVAAGLFGGAEAWLMLKVASILGYHLDFAGIRPEFTIPWGWLWPGALLTAAICGLAALWAGWRIGRIPPAVLMTGSAGQS